MKLANIPFVQELVNQGYISVKKHPVFDLYIYNYTKQASSSHLWNEATEQCRGIICDKDYNIVARPFSKFYNYEELHDLGKEIPDLPFEVYEKLDGSLGILYFHDNHPYIATRGSFDSVQAKHANQILYTKYRDKLGQLDQSKTYLFEIIYNDPSVRNNLVVDYGDTDDIFLIAVIHTDTGLEDDIYDYRHIFKTTIKYDSVSDYLKFRNDSDGKNREGFVIKFANNFRMKLKFEEYFKAHCTQSQLNAKSILESIINNTNSVLREKVKSNLSEEHLIYFDSFVEDLYSKFNSIKSQCENEFKSEFQSRAIAAKYFLQCKYPQVLFAMLDNKDVSSIIWKIVSKQI